MSDTTPEDNGPSSVSTATAPRPNSVPVRVSGPLGPRWLPLAATLLAIVAVALAAWALTSNSKSDSSAAASLPGDPKSRVCEAFNTVSRAVQLQTNTDLGPDPVPQSAVAGNARLALVGGGQYLLNNLDSAVPAELGDKVRSFAQQLQAIGVNALADVPYSDPVQSGRLSDADATRKQIIDLCK